VTVGVVTKSVAIETVWKLRFAAVPPDVRKGFAFPLNLYYEF
jgi:hypothetical protein